MRENNKGVVPRLRFPEFRDAGPWVVKRLGEIGTIVKGKGISKSDIKPDGALPCIRYGELYTVYGEVIREVFSRTDADPADLVFSQEDDVIIPASGETKEDIATASCIRTKGVALGGDLNIFRSPLIGSFLAYYLRGNLQPQISKVAQGDSVVHLYPAQLEALQIAVPPAVVEQQKIADCLTSLDELITLQAQKLDALKAHKKGLMLRLFPREGETTPRLRFPEFRDAGPWEMKRLGDKRVAIFVRDTASRSALHTDTYISTENMLPDFGGVTSASSLPTSGTIKQYQPQDILIANIRPYLKKVWQSDRKGTASNDVIVVRPSSEILPPFLGIVLASDAFISYVMAGAKGLKMPRGDITLIKQYPVPIPTVKKEQQKIADCLSSLDKLIQLQAQKLDALKAHKKGLMQQLFPQEVE